MTERLRSFASDWRQLQIYGEIRAQQMQIRVQLPPRVPTPALQLPQAQPLRPSSTLPALGGLLAAATAEAEALEARAQRLRELVKELSK